MPQLPLPPPPPWAGLVYSMEQFQAILLDNAVRSYSKKFRVVRDFPIMFSQQFPNVDLPKRNYYKKIKYMRLFDFRTMLKKDWECENIIQHKMQAALGQENYVTVN